MNPALTIALAAALAGQPTGLELRHGRIAEPKPKTPYDLERLEKARLRRERRRKK